MKAPGWPRADGEYGHLFPDAVASVAMLPPDSLHGLLVSACSKSRKAWKLLSLGWRGCGGAWRTPVDARLHIFPLKNTYFLLRTFAGELEAAEPWFKGLWRAWRLLPPPLLYDLSVSL